MLGIKCFDYGNCLFSTIEIGETMPKTLPSKMAQELPKLEQGALIELWDIDLRHITPTNGANTAGELYRFHNGLNQGRN